MKDTKEITHQIIGCAMKVHTTMRNGFQELIYHRALEIEFKKAGIAFESEVTIRVLYDGQFVGNRRVDFLVADKVVVEIKAVSQLEPVHFTQAINYCEIYNIA